jgi:DNA-directed RNA polymerase subunit RPC12/RpoP
VLTRIKYIIPKRSKISALPLLEKPTTANKEAVRHKGFPVLLAAGTNSRSTCHDASTLKPHIKTVHGIKTGSLKCSKCEQRFSGQDAVYRHEQSVHRTKPDATNFALQEDDAQNQSVRKIADDVDTNANVIKCPDCDNTFSRADGLYRHQRNVHHIDPRPYKCSKCNKDFAKTESLDQHMSAGHRATHFECVKCRRTFANSDDLATHLDFQHGERVDPRSMNVASSAS